MDLKSSIRDGTEERHVITLWVMTRICPGDAEEGRIRMGEKSHPFPIHVNYGLENLIYLGKLASWNDNWPNSGPTQ